MISYIANFLTEGFPVLPKTGYTADETQFNKYDLVIIPSGFFNDGVYGRAESLPSLPLKELEGIPVLYGLPEVEWFGNTLVVKADLIASAYFLLTRYEEIVRRDVRDEHGRFIGKESLPYRAGFIHRPVIDEYRMLLWKYLHNDSDRQAIISHLKAVELTHDIDAPFLYRSLKGFVRSIINGRGFIKSLKTALGKVDNDPYYTFNQLAEQSRSLNDSWSEVRHLLFFKAANGQTKCDKPYYDLHSREIKQIVDCFDGLRTVTGLHVSYWTGMYPSVKNIKTERVKLEQAFDISVTHSRHHFLSCRNPEDMEYLAEAGITDDYTMGYADVAGFRLGTSRPVLWINPTERRLTGLCLHPLIIMDCTLEESKYMGLSYDEALDYCLMLIENTKKVGGVFSILWHNSSISKESSSYLNRLYSAILSSLENEIKTYTQE